MPNIASVLKEAITRLARKELKAETERLKKVSAEQRTAIADLKRRVAALEATLKRAHRAAAPAVTAQAEDDSPKLRFRHEGLAAHRKRLGLSAEAFGKLIGVSGLTVYKWESGKVHPRASQLPAIAVVRKMGKRKAQAMLNTVELRRDGSSG